MSDEERCRERYVAAHQAIQRACGWERYAALYDEIVREHVGDDYAEGLAYAIAQYGWDRAVNIAERVARREGAMQ